MGLRRFIRHHTGWEPRRQRRLHAEDAETADTDPPLPPEDPLALEKARVMEAHETRSAPPSVLFYTTHKCASSFMQYFFGALTQGSAYRVVDIEAAMWEFDTDVFAGADVSDFISEHSDRLFFRRGEIYSPLRSPIRFPGDDHFRKIFFLRDPRDIAVSWFYSFSGSHPVPKSPERAAAFHYMTELYERDGIDKVVCEEVAEKLAERFDGFARIREDAKDALYVSYDEYAADVEAFTRKIADWLNLDPAPDVLADIAARAQPTQKDVDDNRHQRSGRSRQFEAELQPATIAHINEVLGPALKEWGFKL